MIQIDKSRDNLFDELGLKRLKDSYLRDDETSPQERFAYVSKVFSSNPEHAQRLYDYSSRHWLSYSTPVLSYGRNKNGLPISCFTGDMWVSVKSCGAKQIKDICIGDEVLTHKGRWRKVLNTKKSTSSDLYELRVVGRSTKTKVTGNHPVLTNKGWVKISDLDRSHLIATNAKYNDMVEIPYTIENLDNYNEPLSDNSGRFVSSPINTKIEIDNDLAWAFGLWFAEGSTSNNGTLSITMHENEIEHIIRWKQIISEKFGVNSTNNESVSGFKNNKWSSGSIYSKRIVNWFDNEFGKGCKIKTIPEWILNLPKEQLQHFWDGCYLGDGYKTTHRKKICMSNPALIMQLYHILLKLGNHNLSLTIQIKNLLWLKRDDKTTITSELGIYEVKNHYSKYTNRIDVGVEFGDHIFRPIQSLIKLDMKNIDVYDIMVEEDESFTINGIIAHNCYLGYIHDSKEGLVDALSETNWLSMLGGGIGIGMDIRSADELSAGIMPHLKIYDASSLAYKQGTSRRGSYATYLNIDHPDIEMFIEMRKSTGDPRYRAPNLHHGINITDDFMRIIEKCMVEPGYDDTWELKDPNGLVKGKVSAKKLWEKILETRMHTGEPYLHFIDTANRALPKWLKDKGLKIRQSNLCSEIELPTDKDRTAVCCLSSLNLVYYDEWKDDKLFISDVLEMLDNVLTVFINTAPSYISRAIYSAQRERSVGVGALGFHSLLQKNNIAFESLEAIDLNNRIFHHIRHELNAANIRLGKERGEAPDIQSVIEFEGEDGKIIKINSSDFVTVSRGNDIINIRAFSVQEGDEILG